MIIRKIKKESLLEELKLIGVDERAFDILENKSNLIILKLHNINAKGANILKQEFISAEGDVAVHRDVASWKISSTDCLLIGTKRTYKIVLKKLAFEPFFGLNEIRELVQKTIASKQLPAYSIRNRTFDFEKEKFIMGILNITPDSFSDGGLYNSIEKALKHVQTMIQEGADIIDIGGESTRPGAEKITEEEEKKRTIPIIKEIRKNFPDIPISIDTYKASIAEEALKNGADIINDISGLQFDEKMQNIAREFDAPVIIMHIKGTPKNMQQNPQYEDIMKELLEYFDERINALTDFGIKKIIIDPGIGFGKRLEDNLKIIKNIEEFSIFNLPILLGVSRKSFIGNVLNKTVENRLYGSAAANAYVLLKGANIIRVHDITPHKDLIKMLKAIKNA
ncbi:MAG: dihydropteroate synthase [Caldisericota bacterium]|nr:dihydropteroate synthase [Caldisericota bacterium]